MGRTGQLDDTDRAYPFVPYPTRVYHGFILKSSLSFGYRRRGRVTPTPRHFAALSGRQSQLHDCDQRPSGGKRAILRSA
jgi:hypothetical protein